MTASRMMSTLMRSMPITMVVVVLVWAPSGGQVTNCASMSWVARDDSRAGSGLIGA